MNICSPGLVAPAAAEPDFSDDPPEDAAPDLPDDPESDELEPEAPELPDDAEPEAPEEPPLLCDWVGLGCDWVVLDDPPAELSAELLSDPLGPVVCAASGKANAAATAAAIRELRFIENLLEKSG